LSSKKETLSGDHNKIVYLLKKRINALIKTKAYHFEVFSDFPSKTPIFFMLNLALLKFVNSEMRRPQKTKYHRDKKKLGDLLPS
jgi:hypothetical protein